MYKQRQVNAHVLIQTDLEAHGGALCTIILLAHKVPDDHGLPIWSELLSLLFRLQRWPSSSVPLGTLSQT